MFRLIASLVIVFTAVAGGPAALAQVPSVLEEIKVVTEDAGSASFILRFSPEEPQYSAINSNPSRPELLMRATVRAPRVQPRSAHSSLIRAAVLEPSDTGLRLRFDTAAPAEIRAEAAGDRVIQVTLTRLSEAEAIGVRPIGTSPEEVVPASDLPAYNPAFTEGAHGDSYELISLKYADVSEVIGLLVEGETIQPNNIFIRREPGFGSIATTSQTNYVNAQTQGPRDPVPLGQAFPEANRAAQSVGGRVTNVYSVAIRGFSANLPPQAVERIRANNPNIAYCEQDQVVSIPPIRAQGGGVNGTAVQPAQETPWGIARVNGGAAGSFAIAWVIDTGIELTHPDLNVDTARSRSFIRDSSPNDQNGHGTHVAGTIAAVDNTIGVIGVAPGARVVAVRVLDRRGSGSNSGVIAGVDYVAANGRSGDVANMSLGGGVSQALDDAVVAAAAGGVRFALAAGNESDNANNHSPARANGPNVYTVSAFAVGDKWASFSNFGNPPIDFTEPGVSVKSAWLSGGYNTISGTSMATPHLAGLLLAGPIRSGGNVAGDPDRNADVIGVK